MSFGPANSDIYHKSLGSFLTLAEDLNIPINHDKTITPCTQLELHGILINTVGPDNVAASW